MKRLKKGPELKMPELKVPPFLVDLYWDLRDRRLLPLVALVVVAIVAVPFLLGGGSEELAPPAFCGHRDVAAPTREAAEAASLTVVQAKPGLRDYRKRLAGRKPTDPFKQRYTAPRLRARNSGRRKNPRVRSSSTSTITTELEQRLDRRHGDHRPTTRRPSTSPAERTPPNGGDRGHRT